MTTMSGEGEKEHLLLNSTYFASQHHIYTYIDIWIDISGYNKH